jgi:hypothetical protein
MTKPCCKSVCREVGNVSSGYVPTCRGVEGVTVMVMVVLESLMLWCTNRRMQMSRRKRRGAKEELAALI